MEILVKRRIKTDLSTIGDFYINGELKYHTLEDIDRGLTQDMPLSDIQKIKVKGVTAIPVGRYQLSKYFSPKHNAWVPLLLHVPGFEYVEIHVGNYPKDTDGCLLLGMSIAGSDMIGESKKAIEQFYPLFFKTLAAGEQIFITYQ